MVVRFAHGLTLRALLERVDIVSPADGELYLRRWRLVSTPWGGVYLHKIVRRDEDRHLHDHPWPFVSLILRGGYVEERLCHGFVARTRHRALAVNRVRRGEYHRIARLVSGGPTWSLVLIGQRRGGWGFLVDGRHVNYRAYLEARDRGVDFGHPRYWSTEL